MSNKIVISGYSQVVPDAESIAIQSDNSEFLTTGFETRAALGNKGTRNMDKLTGLSLHCIDKSMPALLKQREVEADRIGIVIGSAQGSMDSIVRFTYETLAYGRPDFVNPALFPNTVMNCPAGQSAIWHGLKGPNATISCGELSGFSAINYAISLIKNGYADTLVAGGIEELTEVNMAANKIFAKKMGVAGRFCEASAFFVIEQENIATKYNREIVAEILAVSMGFNPNVDQHGALSQLLEKTINKSSISANQISHVEYSGTWPQTREVEISAIKSVFGESFSKINTHDTYQTYGNAVSSMNTLQLSLVLQALQRDEYGVLLAQDLKGNMGAMIIKRGGSK